MSAGVTTSDWQPAPAAAPSPLAAIGDIHGAHRQLAALRAHLDTLRPHRRVYLGDLIDPYSARAETSNCADVLDQVEADMVLGAEVLVGNHESLFLIALENGHRRRAGERQILPGVSWYQNGAAATARAFGVEPPRLAVSDTQLGEAVWAAMSAEQRRVIEAMQVAIDHGPYLLVHAGVDREAEAGWRDPATKIRTAAGVGVETHPLWIRYADYEDDAPRGRVLIHGHTPRRTPFLGRRRICIDTGAKVGGPLTAIEIVDDRMRVHQAWADDVSPAAWEKMWRRG
jgi:serine/threonine protein phosphatase 1